MYICSRHGQYSQSLVTCAYPLVLCRTLLLALLAHMACVARPGGERKRLLLATVASQDALVSADMVICFWFIMFWPQAKASWLKVFDISIAAVNSTG